MKRLAAQLAVSAVAVTALTIGGCASDGTMSTTGKGVAVGTASGAAVGALIGSLSGDAGKGALIGAVGGALTGGIVGAYMEEQRQDFEKALAAEIASGEIRVTKLPDHQLLVGMTGATSFETDSDKIKPGFYSTMDKISSIVNEYGKTHLSVAGHTDNTGSAGYNQQLSERRAASVQGYLEGGGVIPARINAEGFGQSQPVASNETELGRRLNRRVDIIIVPITES